jgi:hypothetical protein
MAFFFSIGWRKIAHWMDQWWLTPLGTQREALILEA